MNHIDIPNQNISPSSFESKNKNEISPSIVFSEKNTLRSFNSHTHSIFSYCWSCVDSGPRFTPQNLYRRTTELLERRPGMLVSHEVWYCSLGLKTTTYFHYYNWIHKYLIFFIILANTSTRYCFPLPLPGSTVPTSVLLLIHLWRWYVNVVVFKEEWIVYGSWESFRLTCFFLYIFFIIFDNLALEITATVISLCLHHQISD